MTEISHIDGLLERKCRQITHNKDTYIASHKNQLCRLSAIIVAYLPPKNH